jgi:hypothetical protein
MSTPKKMQAIKDRILVDPDLGLVRDVDIGDKYGIESRVVCRLRHKHNIPIISRIDQAKALMLKDPDLGKLKDGEIGKKYGVNTEVVYRLRKKHGIKGAGTANYHPARPFIEKDPELSDKYVTHAVLAERHGCSVQTIKSVRRENGYHFVYRNSGYNPQSRSTIFIEKRAKENQGFLNQWTRPKGIDALLEQINE